MFMGAIIRTLNGPVPWPDVQPPGDVTAPDGESSMLADAMAWLTDQVIEHNSVGVVYQRRTLAVGLRVSVGTTLMKLNDGDGGIRMEWMDRDYLIRTTDLVLGGSPVEPERGDLILEVRGGRREVYEVGAPQSEQPWRWSDEHHTMIRVHTKLIGTGIA